mgnify:CR=1 FL=1
MVKVSIILKTNRTNDNTSFKQWKEFKDYDNPLIDDAYEFMIKNYFDCDSFIEPTIKSLIDSEFQDFELIIVHRHPEVIKDVVSKYTNKIKIKLIKEKWSPWHDLEGSYPTISNAINTGVIWADGDIIVSTDDCVIFPPKLLGELSEYIVMPKAIKYYIIDDYVDAHNTVWVKKDKYRDILKEENLIRKVWGEWNLLYGYCVVIPTNEMLKLNGFNESLDGAMGEEDGEFSIRVKERFDTERLPATNPIYMFGHDYSNVKDGWNGTRDNIKWRKMIDKYFRANLKRPSDELCNKYKQWHERKYGKVDKYFDTCKKVPTFNLKKLRKLRGTNDKLTGKRIL